MDFGEEEEEGFSSNPNDFPPGVLTSTGSFQGVSGNSPLITARQVVNDNTLAQQYLNQPGVRENYEKFVNAERDLRLAAPPASQTPIDQRTAAFDQRVLGKQSKAANPYGAATLPQASYGAASIAAAPTSIYPPINNMSNIQGTQFSGLGNPSALQGANYGEFEKYEMDPNSDSDSDLDIKTLTEAYGDKMPEGGKGKRRRKRQSTKKKKRRSTKKRKSKKRKQSTNKKK